MALAVLERGYRGRRAGGVACALLLWVHAVCALASNAGALKVGAAVVDITPSRPVALMGQFQTRIAHRVEAPLRAVALALESESGAGERGRAIWISCDLTVLPGSVVERFRARFRGRIPGVEGREVVLSATHTHTAPVLSEDFDEMLIRYEIPEDGSVERPQEYVEFLVEKLCEAAVAAWNCRVPGGLSWTLGHAVIGENRRAGYVAGESRMYGNTAEAGFRRLEGGVDSGVETLFFWDSQRRPIALAVNLSCPAQEVEERNSIHADFWHEARERLRVGLGLPELPVLAWCGAAGDVSPHPMHRKAAEARMDRLRGVSREVELGRRISAAVLETLPVARADVRWKVALVHSREEFRLVRRGIRAEEAEAARRALDDYGREKSPDHRVRALMGLERSILNRFEAREERTPYLAEVHVVRLGDVVIASNPFELFSDFGVQLKARSPALQTMIVQLSNGYGMYVPTESAMRSGGYSGKPHVSRVGAAGGQQLVDSSVHLIEQLFRE